jgi:hypothetical protein
MHVIGASRIHVGPDISWQTRAGRAGIRRLRVKTADSTLLLLETPQTGCGTLLASNSQNLGSKHMSTLWNAISRRATCLQRKPLTAETLTTNPPGRSNHTSSSPCVLRARLSRLSFWKSQKSYNLTSSTYLIVPSLSREKAGNIQHHKIHDRIGAICNIFTYYAAHHCTRKPFADIMSTFSSSSSDDEMTHAAALAVVAVAVADCEDDADNEDGKPSSSAGLRRDAVASRSRTDSWAGRTTGSARAIGRCLSSWEGGYVSNAPIYTQTAVFYSRQIGISIFSGTCLRFVG